jgi:hypothetical protein
MVLESLMMLLTLAAPQEAPDMRVAPTSLLSLAGPPTYQPQERAVGNWRIESALALDLAPIGALRQAIGSEPSQTPRCVKLNNYWCIKRAGWNGEIASDPDGHVAFSTAEEGAAVAALLLRRYYVDYKRHTAREIASRWAPTQCSASLNLSLGGPLVSRAGLSRMLPQRPLPMGLAPRGIANTLRARWLAAHGRGGVAFAATRVRSPTRQKKLDLEPAPAIAEGMGETPHKALVGGGASAAIAPFAPVADCSGDLIRINNYASHIAEGVAGSPDQDLHLFDEAGQPSENLAKVMTNMAAVEIGPLRARPALVSYAVSQLRLLTAADTLPK